MKKEEKAFLPSGSPGVTAVILAAGQSQGLLPLTENLPKPMLDIKGKTILERQIEVLNACGVKDIAVVRGYKKEAIKLPNIRYYDNDEFATTSEVFSLFRASKELGGPFLFLYGDILFERGHLEKLLKSPADISILVDRAWGESYAQQERRGPGETRGAPDLVLLKDAQESGYRFLGADTPHVVAKVGRSIDPREAGHGEFVGMAMFTQKGARRSPTSTPAPRDASADGKFHEAESLRAASFTDLLQELVDAATRCRPSTSTRAGSRSTRSRTTGAPGRCSRSRAAMSHGKGGPSHAPELVAALKAAGFDFFAGVPCSLLKGLVSILDADPDAHYVSATREDSALGMAAGAYLGGKTPMVLMQNSGLGVSVNALASLHDDVRAADAARDLVARRGRQRRARAHPDGRDHAPHPRSHARSPTASSRPTSRWRSRSPGRRRPCSRRSTPSR
jgi:hypothetical protein